jgi:hypothetical protein
MVKFAARQRRKATGLFGKRQPGCTKNICDKIRVAFLGGSALLFLDIVKEDRRYAATKLCGKQLWFRLVRVMRYY